MPHESRAHGLLIHSRHVYTDETLPVIDPATETNFASVSKAGRTHLDMAVRSALEAQPDWWHLPADEREQGLRRLADRLEDDKKALASLLSREQGKPRETAARDEVGFAIQWLRHMAGARLPARPLRDMPDAYDEVSYYPLGVAGLILPWNFPVALAVWKLAPALIVGNTVIMKPSPYTPLTALRIGELAGEVLPPGVVNVVTGEHCLGQWMVEHPDIAKLSFTGSVATGRKVMAAAAGHLKRLTLELGGNDPAIVLPDIDLQEVVPKLFWGAFGNSGQWCVGIKRLYVHESIYGATLNALVEYAKTIKMGEGTDPASQLGPVQNRMQYEKLQSLFADVHAQGYRIVLGGHIDTARPGYFVPVTIIDNPPDDSRVVCEEQFGPILPVLRYTDFDEVVRRANDSEYGLGASIWGEDLALAERLSDQLRVGTVWINQIYAHDPKIPFGGHKQSGLGVEHGFEGLAAYANMRVRMANRRATDEAPAVD